MAKNTGPRTLVYVQLGAATGSLKYAFQSGLRDGLRNDFGQVLITQTTAVNKLALGVNAPKPARANKLIATGYEASFCADNRRASLKQQGYRMIRPKFRAGGESNLSDTVYVTINGIKYTWQIPKITGQPGLAAVGAFGHQKAGASDKDLVFGASFPKPAIAGATSSQTGFPVSFKTFVDPSRENNLPPGFKVKIPAKNTIEDLIG